MAPTMENLKSLERDPHLVKQQLRWTKRGLYFSKQQDGLEMGSQGLLADGVASPTGLHRLACLVCKALWPLMVTFKERVDHQ